MSNLGDKVSVNLKQLRLRMETDLLPLGGIQEVCWLEVGKWEKDQIFGWIIAMVLISGGWRHTMALTSDGKLYGWGWNKFGQVGVDDNCDHCSPVQVKFPHDQKVILISCGWRHTLAVTERQNVFSWGRGTNGQLGHGESVDRYVPRIIEVLSVDGSSGQQIGSSTFDPSTAEKSWVSPTERYAVVPDENVPRQTVIPERGTGNDVNVPENDVKRIRL
ncbi:hypothetical protein MTR67_022869 [Solanum verrucosum]|uniref:Uncharacterized protein n=1 Tax=Solanum verrucosum TaxID=315347 RepID=A0AAF0TRN9_SOLVR|nr:hypothetical protein MTR67_022869 [Solanum verrucosum]